MKKVKILMGGSPCTHWSIAQKNGRETEPGGLGWELFKNYLIAKEKWKPDYFLYENNKSAAPAIKDQIAKELGVDSGDTRFTYINSALVSAQNRQRFYVTNFGDIEQPADRGILLRDVLESTLDEQCYELEDVAIIQTPQGFNKGGAKYDKVPCMTSSGSYEHNNHVCEPLCVAERGRYNPEGIVEQKFEVRADGKTNILTTVEKDNRVVEPINTADGGKSFAVTTRISGAIPEDTLTRHRHPMAAEPIKLGEFGVGGQGNRFYSTDGKSVALSANSSGQRNGGLYVEPVNTALNGKSHVIKAQYYKNGIANFITNSGHDASAVAEPVRIGDIGSDSQVHRVYSRDGKSVTINAGGGGQGGKTGLYAVDVSENITVDNAIPKIVDKKGYLPEMFNPYNLSEIKDKSPTLSTGSMVTSSCATLKVEQASQKQQPIYEVRNGLITIKEKQYPIKLADGFYIIRKLTVNECKRLQTVPSWYDMTPVSNSQAYKCLGNGWTVEVIKHLLSHIPDIQNCEIEVLSMYDGMACGYIALKELGCNVVKYCATEIDKYAMQVSGHNFPDIVQLGDAFQVRSDDWNIDSHPILHTDDEIKRTDYEAI